MRAVAVIVVGTELGRDDDRLIFSLDGDGLDIDEVHFTIDGPVEQRRKLRATRRELPYARPRTGPRESEPWIPYSANAGVSYSCQRAGCW